MIRRHISYEQLKSDIVRQLIDDNVHSAAAAGDVVVEQFLLSKYYEVVKGIVYSRLLTFSPIASP